MFSCLLCSLRNSFQNLENPVYPRNEISNQIYTRFITTSNIIRLCSFIRIVGQGAIRVYINGFYNLIVEECSFFLCNSDDQGGCVYCNLNSGDIVLKKLCIQFCIAGNSHAFFISYANVGTSLTFLNMNSILECGVASRSYMIYCSQTNSRLESSNFTKNTATSNSFHFHTTYNLSILFSKFLEIPMVMIFVIFNFIQILL